MPKPITCRIGSITLYNFAISPTVSNITPQTNIHKNKIPRTFIRGTIFSTNNYSITILLVVIQETSIIYLTMTKTIYKHKSHHVPQHQKDLKLLQQIHLDLPTYQ